MRTAVIGIGSNSVRSLLADVSGADFRRLWRDREGTRLFAGLDAAGNLDRDSMDKTVSAVRQMATEASRQGAKQMAVFATSAARDAANGKEFMEAVERETGLPLRIISGEEEAELSFLGASAAANTERCGMIDIGGGSTEIAIGTQDGIECAFSCQMGAVRLFRRLRLDRKEDMKPVEVAAAEILSEKLAELFRPAYPQIRFIPPGEMPKDCYATYYMGIFFPADDRFHQPTDFRVIGLALNIPYILGLEVVERRPRLTPAKKRPIQEPYVCIAAQSTSHAKYWNNPHGWIETIDFLKALGYRVLCIDKEKCHGSGRH